MFGQEFANHEQMTKTLGAMAYFADPYSSWQRGLNENTNGLLRQYWPKSTDFKRSRQMKSLRLLFISMTDLERNSDTKRPPN
jgi:IS30 family transposase